MAFLTMPFEHHNLSELLKQSRMDLYFHVVYTNFWSQSFKCLHRIWDSSGQTTFFFRYSHFQCFISIINRCLSSLFLFDRSYNRHGQLLLLLTMRYHIRLHVAHSLIFCILISLNKSSSSRGISFINKWYPFMNLFIYLYVCITVLY